MGFKYFQMCQQNALRKCIVNLFLPLFTGKYSRNEFDPVFEAPRFGPQRLVPQNSTPNSGSGGAKSPVR